MVRTFAYAGVSSLLLACGARTSLDIGGSGAGSSVGSGGGGEGGGASVPPCPAWVPTHAPVQVSNIGSIIEPQALITTAHGALVGYADAQFPPVDSSWHARSVAFGDGALGPEQVVFDRNTSGLGWTAISIAARPNGIAAIASDDTTGMQFVGVDEAGAKTGSPVVVPGDSGRYLAATSRGYSAIRSPFNPNGGDAAPVTLASLDVQGGLIQTQGLLGASTPLVFFRRATYGDGSFSLVWGEAPVACMCTELRAQHFDETGAALTAPVTLATLGAREGGGWAVAAARSTLLLVFAKRAGMSWDLVAQSNHSDGHASGSPQRFAHVDTVNEPTFDVAAAPGGDFLAVWGPGDGDSSGALFVGAVGSDGRAEGDQPMLFSGSISSDFGIHAAASEAGAMVTYASDLSGFGIEVFAVPLRCQR